MHHLFFAFQKLIILSLIDNAEDLNIEMPMYNLLEYTKSYQKQQEFYGSITEMNPAVEQKGIKIMLSNIQNLLIMKQGLQED